MKSIAIVAIAGLILLYFMDSAFKMQILNLEMFIHSAIRFLTGFVLIGIGVFYAHKIKLKSAVYLVLALFLADDILDFVRKVENFNFEFMIHSIFMLLWGALMGYTFMKQLKDKADKKLM